MAFQTLEGRLDLATDGIDEGVSDAEDSMSGLQDRMDKVGSRMQSAGKKMTAGVTVPLAAMGAGAARQAANFDQAMQQSIAVMGDVSDSMREDLEATAREVARNTTQSHEQAAQSFYFLSSAGLDAQESMEAMPQVARFAEAGQLDMAEATDTATNIMSAFGKEAEDMNEVTDTLTATISSHNQTMNGMSAAMSRVAPTAAGLGASIEETAAAIGLLGDVGIQGERAGTALNRALTVLSNPTGKAAERLKELGVSVRDSEGNMRSMTDILADFEEAGADASDMAAIFGSEAGPAMASLLQQGSDALKESTSNIKSAEGATREMANTQRETVNAQLKLLKSNLNDVAITIGSQLLPVINKAIQRLQPIGEAFGNLSSRQQKLVVMLGTVAAAIGPVLLGIGALVSAASTAAAGASALGAALALLTGPIGLVAVAIGALAAAFATDFMGIRTLVEDAVDDILDRLDPLISALEDDVVETLEVLRDRTRRGLNMIERFWSNHGDEIMAVVRPMMRLIKTVVIQNLDALITAVRALLAVFRGDWEEAIDIVLNFLERSGKRFRDAGEALVDAIVAGLRAQISIIVGAMRGLGETIMDFLPGSDAKRGPLSDLTEAGKALVEALAAGIKNAPDEAKEAVKDVAKGIREHLPSSDAKTGPLSDITAAGMAIPETLADGIDEGEDALVRRVKTMASAANDALLENDLVKSADEFGQRLVDSAAGGVSVGDIEDHLSERITRLKDAFEDPDTSEEAADKLIAEYQRLSQRLEDVQDAESVTELDQDLVARVAEDQIEDQAEEESYRNQLQQRLRERFGAQTTETPSDEQTDETSESNTSSTESAESGPTEYLTPRERRKQRLWEKRRAANGETDQTLAGSSTTQTGMSAEEIATAVADALDGMALDVEGEFDAEEGVVEILHAEFSRLMRNRGRLARALNGRS